MATIEAKLTADIAQLKKQLKEAEKKLREYGNTVKNTTGGTTNSYNKSAKGIQGANKKITDSNKKTSAGAVELGRALGDLPFGIQGVANNLQQLAFVLGAGAGLQIGIAGVTALLVVLEKQGITIGQLFSSLTGRARTLAQVQQSLAKATAEFTGNARAEAAELRVLLAIARDETNQKRLRERAIETINSRYSTYIGNLKLETINTDKVTNSVNKLTEALLNEAKVRGVRSVIEEAYGKIAKRVASSLDTFSTQSSVQLRQQNKSLRERQKALEQVLPTLREAAKEDESAAQALIKLGNEYDEITNKLKGQGQIERRESIFANIIKKETEDAEKEIQNLIEILRPLLEFDLLFGRGSAPSASAPPGLGRRVLDDVFKVREQAQRVLRQGRNNAPFRTGFFDVFTKQLENGLKTVTPGLSRIEQRFATFREKISTITVDLAGSIAQGFASIGQSIAQGASVIGAVGAAILQTLGGIITQIGEASIAAGVAALALKNLFKSPLAAIAAGGALVAIGAALSSARASTSTIGTGGVGGQGTSNFSGSNTSSFSSGGFSSGRVVFEISGRKLIGVLNNNLSANERLGGNVSIG